MRFSADNSTSDAPPPRSDRAYLAAALAIAGAIAVAAASSDGAAPAVAAEPPPGVVKNTIVAVGDIACPPGAPAIDATCKHAEVARRVKALNPAAVLLLGDIQYNTGTLAEFQNSFAKSWAGLKKVARPVPGNHEYYTPGANGYFRFFGDRAGRASGGYYSYDIGAWHFVALNSNCEIVGCSFGSAQAEWLRADLKANKQRCVGAYWHHPRFSSGRHGEYTGVAPLWRELRKARAEFVLSGHDHNYERFAPQDESGGLAPRSGLRQFVAGTGGKSEYPIGARGVNSQFASANVFGVLSMKLGSSSYSWRFVDESGRSIDRGAARCH